MMRWLAALLLISLLACQRKAVPSNQVQLNGDVDTLIAPRDTGDTVDMIVDTILPPPPPDTLLFFKRSSCFGKCPAYDLSVWTDGTAHYNGRAYTDLPGQWTCTLDSMGLNEVSQWIAANNLSQMSPSYPSDPEEWIPDLPSTTLIWKMNGISGMIFHNHSAPESYRQFEKKIDLWIEDRPWVKDSLPQAE